MEMDRVRKMKLSDTGTLRHCRYMRLGLLDFMICSNGFECWRCEIDQTMQDQFDTHPAFAVQPAKRRLPLPVGGFTFRPDLSYSDRHVWVKPMNQLLRCGLDDLASIFAVAADGVDLPPPDSRLEGGRILAKITAGSKKVEISAPLDGTITAVNLDLTRDPRLVWKAPYDRGWLVMIKPDHTEDLLRLKSGHLARDWFTHKALELATCLMGKAARSRGQHKGQVEGPSVPDGRLIREVVREHWDRIEKILFTP